MALKECADEHLCPKEMVRASLKIQGLQSGLLFTHSDGIFLTSYQFSAVLRKTLWYYSLDPGTHSFRIRTETSAATEGFGPQQLQTIGHWKSRCFRTYIHTNEKMAGYGKT